MGVYALTPIKHDGETLEVGDELAGQFNDEQIQGLISGGSAVEIGSRNYKSAQATMGGGTAVDGDATAKRDALIAKAASEDASASAAVEPDGELVDEDDDEDI